ncbi:hypothetical protein JCM24511_09244 [Saitozyma sp. JCM 24511]|nr:hypothetical protein JCM24511_09244 [Saitozyma sp. JCM 24511]
MTPPDKSSPALHLLVQPYLLYTLQYPASTPVPPSLFTGKHPFLSVTSSPGEITLVIGRDDEAGGTNTTSSAAGDVDLWEELGMGRPRESAGPWRAFRVRGPLDLSLTGILNELTTPLRHASVPIYALSTWDTDYVLVRSDRLDEAVRALEADGWEVIQPGQGA